MQREGAALATLKSQRFYVFRSSSRALASKRACPAAARLRRDDQRRNAQRASSVAPVSRALSLAIRGLIVQVSA